MTSGVPKKYIFANWGVPSMVPIVSFKETTGHGRVGFSMGAHSFAEHCMGGFFPWDSLLNSGLIFLMNRFKSTRVSGNVIIRLGGRVMKNVVFVNLGVPSHGPHSIL